MWEAKETIIAKTILQKKNKVGGNTLPGFKTQYIAMVIKIMWYSQKGRHTNQWTRIENPKIDPCKYAQMVFDKGAEAIQQKKDSLFKMYWRNQTMIITRKKKEKKKKRTST